MKIIKQGFLKNQIQYIEQACCSECDTVVEFDKSECDRISYSIAVGLRDGLTQGYNMYYIKCPVCGNGSLYGFSKRS